MNKYYQAKEYFENGELRYISLSGLNFSGDIEGKLSVVGEVDALTINAVKRNYAYISRNLEVYPTITIYPETHKLWDGNAGGLYYSENNHIELIDSEYIISNLAHEMRHAYQYIYYPDIFYASEYRTVIGYLDCYVERDARTYAYDYCIAREYWNEANGLSEMEETWELVIARKLSPKKVGMNAGHYRKNPQVGITVPRDYHTRSAEYNGSITIEESTYTFWDWIVEKFQQLVGIIVIFIVIIFAIGYFDSDGEKSQSQSQNQTSYVLEQSSTEYLSHDDLSHLDAEELRLARNEIYARHGFTFGEGELKNHFEAQSWYKANKDFSETLLSDIEHTNIALILTYEN